MPRKRTNRVYTRMDDIELNKYEKLVAKSKLNKQDYNLKCLLDKEIYVVDGIIDLAHQIRRIGVNINQITLIANANRNIDPDDIKKLNDEVKASWSLLNDFVKSIKK